jgi:hypothetical protein
LGLGTFDQLAENLNAAIEVRQLALIQSIDGVCERFYSSGSTRQQNALSLRRRDDSGEAFVVRVGPALDEAIFFQASHDLRHRGRPHLFSARELAQRYRTSEDDDGERRQPWRGQATGVVLFAQLAEQVNGGGVQLVCQLRAPSSPRPH